MSPFMFNKLHPGSGAGSRVRRRLFALVTALTLIAPLLLAGAMPVAAYSTADPAHSTIVVDNNSVTVDDTVHITVTLNKTDNSPVGASDGTVALFTTLGLIGAVTDHANGTYTADLNSHSPGTATITGTLDGDAITGSGTVNVDFAVGAANRHHTTITAAAGPFTVDPATPSAGLTVQLKDQYGNNLTTNGGTVVLTPSAGNAVISGLAYAGSGTWTATVDLTNNVPTQLTVGGTLDGNAIDTGDAAVDFLPGALDHFTIDTVGNQTAGTPFSPKFRAFDKHDNPKTDYGGGASALSGLADSPGCGGCVPPIPAATPEYGTLSWANGIASPSVTAYDADASSTIKVADGSINKTSDPFVVAHSATLGGFTFVTVASSSTAGDSFNVKVKAYDLYGNVKTDQASGTLSGLNASPGCSVCAPPIAVATPTYGTNLDWTAGDGTGSSTVTAFEANDTASLTISLGGVSNTATFDEGPAGLGGFSIDTVGDAVAGADITVKVTAYDTYGNIKDDYTGSNTLSGLSDSPGCADCNPAIPAKSPGYGTLVWANGVGTATVHAYKTGTSSVSYTEGGFSATSNTFNVTEAALGGFTIANIANQTASSTGFTVTANAYDLYGNAKTGYTTGATVSGTLGTSPTCSTCANGGTARDYGSLSWLNGVGTATVKAYKAETGQTITVSDSGASVSRTSNSFNVGFAAVAVLDFSIPSLAIDAQAGFSGEPNTTKKGTPIYHICALPGSGTDPCNTASPPVKVLARDQFGNLTSGVTVNLTAFVNPGTGFTGTTSVSTDVNGLASFGSPNPLLITPATATGPARLSAAVTAGPSRLSATFQVVDDLEACGNATCDNLATSGQTSYSRIDATAPAALGPVTTGLLDGVSLVTQFQSSTANCGQTTTQVGRTTDVHIEALGGVPTLNYKVALIVPKSLLQSTGYASRNPATFNVCFGATFLGAGSPSTLWQAKTSPTNATLTNAALNGGLYWGWLPDCSIKKTPPTLDPANPCIVLRTKNASTLQAALGLSATQFATLKFGPGDLAIVYQTRSPWDAKGSIF